MKEDKAALRRAVRAEIDALPEAYISRSDALICKNAASLPEFTAARTVMLYCSVGREAATQKLAELALKEGKTIAYPYCYKGGRMDARIIRDLRELKPAMLGIPAPPSNAPVLPPEEIELIIVPALAFDADGFRLGYGGGYYDRFLPGLTAFTAGLARSKLLKNALPKETHDIAVQCVVTEAGVLRHPPKTLSPPHCSGEPV